ncbi:GATA zinc finger domain-containing protein 14-like [Gouania willdenowi]|uniref:GATA zinc finger domain-containing protein 14-like n=1 Tax=Gouania willdenowi TaxID=441366 RepID=A0A8C5DZA1_GOUWI|nr:GATA zinc finger domain-containing protein 14-like [Gouania willdenowi]
MAADLSPVRKQQKTTSSLGLLYYYLACAAAATGSSPGIEYDYGVSPKFVCTPVPPEADPACFSPPLVPNAPSNDPSGGARRGLMSDEAKATILHLRESLVRQKETILDQRETIRELTAKLTLCEGFGSHHGNGGHHSGNHHGNHHDDHHPSSSSHHGPSGYHSSVGGEPEPDPHLSKVLTPDKPSPFSPEQTGKTLQSLKERLENLQARNSTSSYSSSLRELLQRKIHALEEQLHSYHSDHHGNAHHNDHHGENNHSSNHHSDPHHSVNHHYDSHHSHGSHNNGHHGDYHDRGGYHGGHHNSHPSTHLSRHPTDNHDPHYGGHHDRHHGSHDNHHSSHPGHNDDHHNSHHGPHDSHHGYHGNHHESTHGYHDNHHGNQHGYHDNHHGNHHGYHDSNHGNQHGYHDSNHGNNHGYHDNHHGNQHGYHDSNHGNHHGYHDNHHGNHNEYHDNHHGNLNGYHDDHHGNHHDGNHGNHHDGNHGNHHGYHDNYHGYHDNHHGYHNGHHDDPNAHSDHQHNSSHHDDHQDNNHGPRLLPLSNKDTATSGVGHRKLETVLSHLHKNPEHGNQKKSSGGFLLDFPLRSNYMFARMKPTLLSEIYAMTVCVRVKAGPGPGMGTPFSYAVNGQANELVLMEWGDNPMELLVNDQAVKLPITLSDHQWHHVCVTWTTRDGMWEAFQDGVKKGWGQNLSPWQHIKPGGVFILGQEQDSVGGLFDVTQSFLGELSDLQLWSRVLSVSEVSAQASCGRHSQGDVLSWSEDNLELHGGLALLPFDGCH